MKFNWRSILKVRMTRKNILLPAGMACLSLVAGLALLSPLDFDFTLAFEHMIIPVKDLVKISLFVLGLGFISFKLFSKGYCATAEYIGAFACLFALMPVTGVFAGLPKGVDPMGVLLLFNGVMAGIFVFSAFVSISLLARVQVTKKAKSQTS